MQRSGSRIVVVVVVASLFAGCAGPSWPRQATAITATGDLAARPAPVRTIDILPLDLEVWTHKGFSRDADDVRQAAEARIVGLTSETFYRRGYTVGAVMDWTGSVVLPDGSSTLALEPQALLATVDSLASYGTAVGDSTTLPAPFLPARLGDSTGSDATLYIGGWGFVGKEPENGKLVGKIIVGTILVVGIVVIAVALAKSGAGDPIGKLIGGAAKTVVNTAASVGRAALRASLKAGSATVQVGKAIVETPEGAELILDVLGRATTHLQLVSGRPEWYTDKSLPHSGRPRMYLEMTLVDNHTGVVLWHAHQQFPANASRGNDVVKAATTLLATLPPG